MAEREKFEERLFRVLKEAGYNPMELLTISIDKLVEIKNITVPEIRVVLCMQKKMVNKDGDERRKRFERAVTEAAIAGMCDGK